MNYSIKYLDEAKIDLRDIVIYIWDYSISVAQKIVKFLTDKIDRELSITPHMYREYSPWIRVIPHKWYVIFYKVNDEKKLVEIITVAHWARDLNNLNNLDIKKD